MAKRSAKKVAPSAALSLTMNPSTLTPEPTSPSRDSTPDSMPALESAVDEESALPSDKPKELLSLCVH